MADDNELLAAATPQAPQDDFINSLRGVLAPTPGYTYGSVLPIRGQAGPNGTMTNVGPGIPDWARSIGSGVVDLLDGPRTGQVTPDATNALIALGAGGAAGPADAATARVFGGWGSGTADRAALKTAQKMEAGAGASPEEIWQQTGWYRGTDNMWKNEIPDTGAKWTDAAPMKTKVMSVAEAREAPEGASTTSQEFHIPFTQTRTLGDILDHPELFKAYPGLKDTVVRNTGPFSRFDGLNGAVYTDGSIGLTSGPPDEVMSTLMHEIQHKIQGAEGFAAGGNPSMFLPTDFQQQQTAARQAWKTVTDKLGPVNPFTLQNALDKQAMGVQLYPHEEMAYKQAAKTPGLLQDFQTLQAETQRLNELAGGASRNYRQLSGEVESRNVQARLRTGDTSSLPTEGQSGNQIFHYPPRKPIGGQ